MLKATKPFGTLKLEKSSDSGGLNEVYLNFRGQRMRSSLVRMRSSLVVRASDCQCTSCNGPGFDPSIRRHSGIGGAADEAVLNIVRKKREKIPQKNI
jgi:hypothetical protein